MAMVNVVFGKAVDGAAQVASGIYASSENITSSGTSQKSTASAGNSDICTITCSGGDIRVEFGADPTATASSILILDGQTRDFGLLFPGCKVAVIDEA